MAVRGHFLVEPHRPARRRRDPAAARAVAIADRAFDRPLVALIAGYELERLASGATIDVASR